MVSLPSLLLRLQAVELDEDGDSWSPGRTAKVIPSSSGFAHFELRIRSWVPESACLSTHRRTLNDPMKWINRSTSGRRDGCRKKSKVESFSLRVPNKRNTLAGKTMGFSLIPGKSYVIYLASNVMMHRLRVNKQISSLGLILISQEMEMDKLSNQVGMDDRRKYGQKRWLSRGVSVLKLGIA